MSTFFSLSHEHFTYLSFGLGSHQYWRCIVLILINTFRDNKFLFRRELITSCAHPTAASQRWRARTFPEMVLYRQFISGPGSTGPTIRARHVTATSITTKIRIAQMRWFTYHVHPPATTISMYIFLLYSPNYF